jgi:thiol-disulfide isomerase/thioredoxin
MGDPKESGQGSSGDEAVDGFKASESTDPDPTVGISVVEPLPTAPLPTAPPPTSPRIEIPAPKLERSTTRLARGLDAVGLVAMLAFVLVGGLLVFGFAQALVPAAEAQLGAACRPLSPTPKSGPAPALELEDLDGNPVSLEQFRGKFLVVNFWATWCDPCTREWPDLDLLATRLIEREDIVVLAISVDQDIAVIAPFLERMGLGETNVQILRAKAPDAQQLWGSDKIPDTYFVSPEGALEAVFVNVREWGRPKAIRCVEASAAQ